jgi:hypothetical protein
MGNQNSGFSNKRRVTNFVENSAITSIMKNVKDEKEKEVGLKKEIQRERDNLQYGNSLAVKTFQIDNNFDNLKTNLKLLDSNFDIWNFHQKSSINVKPLSN